MDEWNKLVDKNWEYWEYYRDLFDFTLTKAANSVFTRTLYPAFYQDKLLKREFVENMQLLGELKPEEISEFEKISGNQILKYVYNYYKKPTGGYFGYFNTGLLFVAAVLPATAYKCNKSYSWYVVPPLLFILFGSFASQKVLHINLGQAVDMTQWALEQRKAQVWLEEKKHPTAKLAPFPELQHQIVEIVKSNQP